MFLEWISSVLMKLSSSENSSFMPRCLSAYELSGWLASWTPSWLADWISLVLVGLDLGFEDLDFLEFFFFLA